LYGLGERHVVHALKEAEDVAIFSATEAVIATDLGPNVEAGAALIVEGAQALERSDTRTLQGDVVADDVCDVDSSPNLIDVASSNQARHALILGWLPKPTRPGGQ